MDEGKRLSKLDLLEIRIKAPPIPPFAKTSRDLKRYIRALNEACNCKDLELYFIEMYLTANYPQIWKELEFATEELKKSMLNKLGKNVSSL